MSDIFCRKIYVDSAQRISGTPSNFNVSLVRDVAVPKRCAAFVSDVSIPHTWLNVDEHADRLYWDEYNEGAFVTFKIASFQQKNYTGSTLAAAMEEEMNAATSMVHYMYKVHYASDPGKIQANLVLNVNLAHNWQLSGASQPLAATDHPLVWDSGANQIQITNWGADAQGPTISVNKSQSGVTGTMHLVGPLSIRM